MLARVRVRRVLVPIKEVLKVQGMCRVLRVSRVSGGSRYSRTPSPKRCRTILPRHIVKRASKDRAPYPPPPRCPCLSQFRLPPLLLLQGSRPIRGHSRTHSYATMRRVPRARRQLRLSGAGAPHEVALGGRSHLRGTTRARSRSVPPSHPPRPPRLRLRGSSLLRLL